MCTFFIIFPHLCNLSYNTCTSKINSNSVKLLSVVLTCGQIVSVLREGNGGDGARVAREVGHIGAFLQIPDLDLGISRPSAKNETIRVELSTGESCWKHIETSLCGSGRHLRKLSNTSKKKIEALTTAGAFISDFGENPASLNIRKGPVLQSSKDEKWENVTVVTFLTSEEINSYLSTKYSLSVF